MKKFVCIIFLFNTGVAKAQNTAESYIEKHKEAAIRMMDERGIPASIILAVAMHESANGNSVLARKLNNHFGIKGVGGGSYYLRKDKKVKSSYKKFSAVADAYKDFARLIAERKAFRHLTQNLSHYDYMGWARGMQKSGYAHSKTWSSQVMSIIRKYHLYDFDGRPDADSKLLPVQYLEPVEDKTDLEIYRVRKGDTLSLIAKKFKTSVKKIQVLNRLRNSQLKIGQILKI
ncbi:MAG: glucosaminidase domain-containing protein [Sphingobacteriaceae bacterium]